MARLIYRHTENKVESAHQQRDVSTLSRGRVIITRPDNLIARISQSRRRHGFPLKSVKTFFASCVIKTDTLEDASGVKRLIRDRTVTWTVLLLSDLI